MQVEGRRIDSKQPEYARETLHEKIEILENSEESEIDHNAERQPFLPRRGTALRRPDQDSREVVEEAGCADQQQKPPIKPSVENVAGNQDEQIVEAPPPRGD